MPILRLVWDFRIAVAICKVPFFSQQINVFGDIPLFHSLPVALSKVGNAVREGWDRVWGVRGVRGGGWGVGE